MPADGDVDLGELQHVPDMEHAGDVGRRNDERKYAPRVLVRGGEDAGVDPPLGPMGLEAPGLVDFLNLHGKFNDTKACGDSSSKAGPPDDWGEPYQAVVEVPAG